MTGTMGLNLALPGAGLLDATAARLAFEGSEWLHLTRYLERIETWPVNLNLGPAAAGGGLAALRAQAEVFGTPRRLRQLIQERPDVMAGDQPPAPLYAALAWEIQRLHESAAAVVSFLQSLAKPQGSAGNVKDGLLQLGRQGEKARSPVGPLIVDLKSFQTNLLSANAAFVEACQADTAALHQMQEELGALQVRVETVQKQIGELGIFSIGKKHELQHQLAAMQQELRDKSARAEQQRLALSQVDPVLSEASWIEQGMNDLINFLEQVRKAWTAFGSGVAQLAADASEPQLGDPAWLAQVLGLDEAVRRWSAVERAAKQFAAQSLVDVPPGD